MKKFGKKKMFLSSAALLLFTASGLFLYQEMVNAGECQIVKLSKDPAQANAIQIEPAALWIKKGTCVVWFNDRILTSKPDIMIKFREGKKCDEMTDASAGFSLDNVEGCYVTGLIPYGGTSSLRFGEKGTFEYEVIAAGKEVAKGRIEVSE